MIHLVVLQLVPYKGSLNHEEVVYRKTDSWVGGRSIN